MVERTSFRLVGGHQAVDFVNTLGGTEQGLDEWLLSYSDLVAWAERAALLTSEHAILLQATAKAKPHRAAAALDAARQFRAHLDAVLRAELTHHAPEIADLDAIRDSYVNALRRGHIRRHPPAYQWEWPPPSDADGVLWPLAHQAVDLLETADLTRLKQCAACRWLYLDTTKNHSRRWCTPDECGARTRMRRHRAARRQS